MKSSAVGTQARINGSTRYTCAPLSTNRCRKKYTTPIVNPRVVRLLSDAERIEPKPKGKANSSDARMPARRAMRDQKAVR